MSQLRENHVVPLACGGPDAVANLQWQTIGDAKLRTRGSAGRALVSFRIRLKNRPGGVGGKPAPPREVTSSLGSQGWPVDNGNPIGGRFGVYSYRERIASLPCPVLVSAKETPARCVCYLCLQSDEVFTNDHKKIYLTGKIDAIAEISRRFAKLAERIAVFDCIRRLSAHVAKYTLSLSIGECQRPHKFWSEEDLR